MLYFILFILFVGADQLSKYYISNNFKLFESIPVINNILYLTYIKNAGAAFGILQNHQIIFIGITSIVLIITLFYFIISPKDSILLRSSLLLIMAGGVGNLIDRIRFRYVIDFIDVRIWPVFNIADSLVVIGSILLSYFILFKYKEVNNDRA